MHIRHVRPSAFHSFIFALNSDKDFEFLISSGTSDSALGPLKGDHFSTMETVCIFEVLNSGPLHNIWVCQERHFIKLGERLFFTLNISVTSFYKFLWWIVKDLSKTSSSSNDDIESL